MPADSGARKHQETDAQVYHIRPFHGAKKPSRYADLRGLFGGFRGLVHCRITLARKGPLTGPGEVDQRPWQRTRGYRDRRPRMHESRVEDHQRVGRVIQCEAQRHRRHVARPFTEQGVPAAVGEGIATIEQPRRGGGAQERKQARDVRIRIRLADQQLHDAGVHHEADRAPDPEPEELPGDTPPHYRAPSPNIRRIEAASGLSITPRSVTMASINSAGVTSKTGFHAFAPCTTVRDPACESSSAGSRSSISIALPEGVSMSTVDDGATTMNFAPWCLAEIASW